MSAKIVNGKKYELVAPDGGWGYMVCIGAVLNTMTITAFVACFGMIYNNLFIELDMDSTSITLLQGVGASCIAISGIFTAPLLKFLSLRQLGLITAALFNIGQFMAVFAKSKIVFFISIGVLQSTGNGMIFNLSCTAINNYFVKKRLLAVSFTHAFVGIFGLFSPQFVKWSLETYGLRGTMLLISGFSLQNILGMMLMQPVEWHMKMVKVPMDKEDEKKLLASEEKPLMSEGDMNIKKSSIVENNVNTEENVEDQKSSVIKAVVFSILDVSLFKTFVLSNACVGMSLVVFVENAFSMLLPQALYAMGCNEDDVAFSLSLSAMGDLATRFFFIFTSSWLLKIGSHEIYVIGLVLSFIARIGMLWSVNKLVMVIFIAIMGVSRCSIATLVQVVIADAVEPEKFSSAMGLFLLLFGFFNLVVGPIVGAIRDLTDSYSTAFYILTSCMGIVILFWTIELIYKKNKHKRQQNEDALKV
ncbi:unnamed protein product [Euphydryas editha]|uniref:Major facilitator superfamily (MFS) profile domain-containing protein n=1 Tax=Euphydryas editha TaxID=104508 RepID=A0AAU9UWF8_EUPED|nr:unnamed protein product [Euphydryas editha]